MNQRCQVQINRVMNMVFNRLFSNTTDFPRSFVQDSKENTAYYAFPVIRWRVSEQKRTRRSQ